mmetsp:Transcript_33069/g.80358  ORF Transcript_33069/g.80358 Transcript_33069/m.80358 type:complete len:1277 (+) Transcript_33069:152-3982(+)
MTLTKKILTKATKKGQTAAISVLESLSSLADLPPPVFEYEAGGSTKKPSHFYKVRFRVPSFLEEDDENTVGGRFRKGGGGGGFTVTGAGRCTSKKSAKSLAALEVIHRMEMSLCLQRDQIRKDLETYKQQRKATQEELESLPAQAEIPNVSWSAIPVDPSLSAAVPASREGCISFLRHTDGCAKSMLIAKAMTLACEEELPDIVSHGNQTDEGATQRFANIRSKSKIVPSPQGPVGELSYGANYDLTVQLALQSAYIESVVGTPTLRHFVKESSRLKKRKVAHRKRYRGNTKKAPKAPSTQTTFYDLLDSFPYDEYCDKIRNGKTHALFQAIMEREREAFQEEGESSSSFGMAKLLVQWPKHQTAALKEAIETIVEPKDELWYRQSNQQQHHRRYDDSNNKYDPEYHESRLQERISIFRKHQQKTSLPIDELEQQIPVRAEEEADITIVCGGTGSGKTTRYPLMVSLFSSDVTPAISQRLVSDQEDYPLRQPKMRMVVAQPRRLACQAAAKRVALEQGYTTLGSSASQQDCPVGYSIRFESKPSSPTQDRTIDFQTIGVVLATAATDPLLSHVTHLVLDEVHERNADMDLLLALAKNIQKQRKCHETLPPLKIILMSATLDAEGWEDYFSSGGGDDVDVKIDKVTVSDATRFPIEIIHHEEKGFSAYGKTTKRKTKTQQRRLNDEQLWKATGNLANSIIQQGRLEGGGSILCFLPGMEEIRTVQRMIDRKGAAKNLKIITLHSSVSSKEQGRIFEAGPKCILSTNIAETSVTIPDVKYIVDPGRERQSSMLGDDDDNNNNSSQLESQHASVVGSQLVTVDIAKSSAKQRAGRAGRVAPGTVYRLYTRDDHDNRPAFTKPEILRMDLTQLVLHSISLCGDPKIGVEPLGLISGAPDPPPNYKLEQALNSLVEQGLVAYDDDDSSYDQSDGWVDGVIEDLGDEADSSPSDVDDDYDDRNVKEGEKKKHPHLTHLGKVVSNIPTTPRIGRMLMVGLALRAVEPALTIAALLSVPKVFSRNIRRDGDDGSEESCSDIIQQLERYQEYQAADEKTKRSMHSEREFAQVSKVRKQLEKVLVEVVGGTTKEYAGGDRNKTTLVLSRQWNENGDRVGAQACMISVVSQHVASLVDGRGAFATRDCAGTARIHPSSINYSHDKRAHWYLYNDLRKTSHPYLHVTTAASPLEVALFCSGGTRTKLDDDMEVIKDMLNWSHVADQWIPVQVVGKKIFREVFPRLKEILNHDMLNEVSRDPDSFLQNKDYKLLVDLVMSAVEQQRRKR